MTELPGKALAQELMQQSRAESRATPMDGSHPSGAGGQVAGGRKFSPDRATCGRWSGCSTTFTAGWGQGLEIGDFPPSVKYLFSRQIMDESTHEMLYLDTLLRRRWVKTQKEAFGHPYGQFHIDSALAYYAFSLRNLATYPHPIRIAALNLGAKIVELTWMEDLAEALTDTDLQRVFTSQFVENRSHINMGRRIVEECVSTPFEAEFVAGRAAWSGETTACFYAS